MKMRNRDHITKKIPVAVTTDPSKIKTATMMMITTCFFFLYTLIINERRKSRDNGEIQKEMGGGRGGGF